MAIITITPDSVIGEVHPQLYGSFIEHLGRVVYGGIWEEGAPLSDEDGYRVDVREAILVGKGEREHSHHRGRPAGSPH